MTLMSHLKDAVTGTDGELDSKHEPVTARGKITDVFGHRFVVHTTNGKILADIGPKALATIALKAHDEVEIEGEQKPTEIKVKRIAIAGGEMRETHHGGPKGNKHDHDGPFNAEDASALAKSEGFDIDGELRPHKKHFEAKAKKDGRVIDIHIHRDGVHVH